MYVRDNHKYEQSFNQYYLTFLKGKTQYIPQFVEWSIIQLLHLLLRAHSLCQQLRCAGAQQMQKGSRFVNGRNLKPRIFANITQAPQDFGCLETLHMWCSLSPVPLEGGKRHRLLWMQFVEPVRMNAQI